MSHIEGKQFILYQMIYHIQGDPQVGGVFTFITFKHLRIIKKKTLCVICMEQRDTFFDCALRYVEADVSGISGKQQLISIAAAELYSRRYLSKFYKFIEYLGLIASKMTIGSCSRIPPAQISRLPIRARPAPSQPIRVSPQKGGALK